MVRNIPSILCLSVYLAIGIGCENTPMPPFLNGLPYRCSYVSKVGGKQITFGITDKEIEAMPKWTPKSTPPLSISEATSIAELELSKYTHGNDGWVLHSVGLERIGHGEKAEDKWLYLVMFRRGHVGEYMNIPIQLDKRPIQGVIEGTEAKR